MARALLRTSRTSFLLNEGPHHILLSGARNKLSANLSRCTPAGFARRTQQIRPQSSKVPMMAGDSFPTEFAEPIKSYDAHIYFFQGNPASSDSARKLRDTVIEKFPHLEVYRFHEKPIGPHPTGMFEVDMRTPAQFAEFVPWLQVHHGMHSVLIHPHTGDAYGDHTERALWLGEKVPLITSILKGEAANAAN